MMARLLSFRAYLTVFAASLYLLSRQHFEGSLTWLGPTLLLVCSLALARTRLRLHRPRSLIATSELFLIAAVVDLPSPLAAAVAAAVTVLRCVGENPGQLHKLEIAGRTAFAAFNALLASLLYSLFQTQFGVDLLSLGAGTFPYLLLAGLIDSLEDRLPHWKTLLRSSVRSGLAVAALFCPAAMFLKMAFEPIPSGSVWIAAPLLIVLYLLADWRLGPLYDDQRRRHEADQIYLPAVEALALAVEAKDSVSSAHLKRVQRYCVEIAKALNCSEEEIRALEFGALLHDIGKIAVPEPLLTKPGRLSPQEFSQMAVHPQVGAEILSAVDFPFPVAELVLCHHENWDGSGYPRRLKGEQIPLTARILSVVDAFDALTSDRPYRPAMSAERALEIIRSRRGKAFEPQVTDTLIEILPRIEEEFRREREAVRGSRQARRGFTRPRSLEAEQTSLTFEERIESLKQARPPARKRAWAEDLTAWYRLLETLGATLSPKQILDFILPMLRVRMPLDECAVFLSQGYNLTPVYCTGSKAELLRDLQVPIGDSPTGWVAGHGETLLNGNPMRESGELGTMAWLLGLNSALVCPLWEAGRAVGTINIYSKAQAAYSYEHAAMMERLTATLGGVLLRAGAYESGDAGDIDRLTRLPTARHGLAGLSALVKEAGETGGTVSVVYIDVDNFRIVNSRLGYSRGDLLLRALCQALIDCFPDPDFLCRLGNDHFIGLLRNTSQAQLASLVKKLKLTVRERSRQDSASFDSAGFDAPLRISVGAASYPTEVASAEALLVLSSQRSYLDKISRSAIPAKTSGAKVDLAIPTKAV